MKYPQKRVVAVISARMASTRLPGKMLMSIGDKTLLEWVVARVQLAKSIDEIVVATTEDISDDLINSLCIKLGIKVFRGSKDDVLSRFYLAAKASRADYIVRVNGDNPLIDPYYINQLVMYMKDSKCDYVSWLILEKPVMLSAISFFAEIISFECVERASKTINSAFDREHVTLGIYNRPSEYNVHFIPVPEIANDLSYRFTLDTIEDFDILTQIINHFDNDIEALKLQAIINYVEGQTELRSKMVELNGLNKKTIKD